LWDECYYTGDYAGAAMALRTLCDVDQISVGDFQRLLLMLRDKRHVSVKTFSSLITYFIKDVMDHSRVYNDKGAEAKEKRKQQKILIHIAAIEMFVSVGDVEQAREVLDKALLEEELANDIILRRMNVLIQCMWARELVQSPNSATEASSSSRWRKSRHGKKPFRYPTIDDILKEPVTFAKVIRGLNSLGSSTAHASSAAAWAQMKTLSRLFPYLEPAVLENNYEIQTLQVAYFHGIGKKKTALGLLKKHFSSPFSQLLTSHGLSQPQNISSSSGEEAEMRRNAAIRVKMETLFLKYMLHLSNRQRPHSAPERMIRKSSLKSYLLRWLSDDESASQNEQLFMAHILFALKWISRDELVCRLCAAIETSAQSFDFTCPQSHRSQTHAKEGEYFARESPFHLGSDRDWHMLRTWRSLCQTLGKLPQVSLHDELSEGSELHGYLLGIPRHAWDNVNATTTGISDPDASDELGTDNRSMRQRQDLGGHCDRDIEHDSTSTSTAMLQQKFGWWYGTVFSPSQLGDFAVYITETETVSILPEIVHSFKRACLSKRERRGSRVESALHGEKDNQPLSVFEYHLEQSELRDLSDYEDGLVGSTEPKLGSSFPYVDSLLHQGSRIDVIRGPERGRERRRNADASLDSSGDIPADGSEHIGSEGGEGGHRTMQVNTESSTGYTHEPTAGTSSEADRGSPAASQGSDETSAEKKDDSTTSSDGDTNQNLQLSQKEARQRAIRAALNATKVREVKQEASESDSDESVGRFGTKKLSASATLSNKSTLKRIKRYESEEENEDEESDRDVRAQGSELPARKKGRRNSEEITTAVEAVVGTDGEKDSVSGSGDGFEDARAEHGVFSDSDTDVDAEEAYDEDSDVSLDDDWKNDFANCKPDELENDEFFAMSSDWRKKAEEGSHHLTDRTLIRNALRVVCEGDWSRWNELQRQYTSFVGASSSSSSSSSSSIRQSVNSQHTNYMNNVPAGRSEALDSASGSSPLFGYEFKRFPAFQSKFWPMKEEKSRTKAALPDIRVGSKNLFARLGPLALEGLVYQVIVCNHVVGPDCLFVALGVQVVAKHALYESTLYADAVKEMEAPKIFVRNKHRQYNRVKVSTQEASESEGKSGERAPKEQRRHKQAQHVDQQSAQTDSPPPNYGRYCLWLLMAYRVNVQRALRAANLAAVRQVRTDTVLPESLVLPPNVKYLRGPEGRMYCPHP
jgi:hypothetical protein